jgi:hypothetical protein
MDHHVLKKKKTKNAGVHIRKFLWGPGGEKQDIDDKF